MKKLFPIFISIGLLLAFYFIAKNSGTADRDFRIIDESIQSEYNKLRIDYLNSSINQQQYYDGVSKLAKKENDLVEEVKHYKFENITESNYWYRGRLKFPSRIKMEMDRMNKALKDSSGYDLMLK